MTYEKSVSCSCVLVRAPSATCAKTVLVYDQRKKGCAWTFPGGNAIFLHNLNRWETPLETARRKLLTETGLVAATLVPLMMMDKGTYTWHLFEAPFNDLDGLSARGDKGQFVSKFPIPQLTSMEAFLKPHKDVLIELDIRS